MEREPGQRSAEHDGGGGDGTSGGDAGKRTRTERLSVQRKASAAPPVLTSESMTPMPVPMDDPFSLHLAAPIVARKSDDAASAEAAAPSGTGNDVAAAVRLARTGQRIELPHRAQVEAKVRRSIATLQVYSGPEAAQACAMIGAEAFTYGNTIVFADPSPPLATVVHEVTHALQQGGDRMTGEVPVADGVTMSSEGDAAEAEATAAEHEGAPTAEVAEGGGAGLEIAAEFLPRELQVARKPGVTDFCKVTSATPLLDKPGGKKVVDLAVGTFVRVDKTIGPAYEVTVVDGGANKGKTGVVPGHTIAELQGIIGGRLVFNKGQLGGTLSDNAINCLGHASGSNAATTVGQNALSDMIQGLGFTTIVGDHTALKNAIKQKKDVMMVYLYMFRSDWRDAADQPLSYADLAKKYGWTASSWTEKNVFVSAAGVRQPIDYHALKYEHGTGKWGYVAHLKPKESDGSYKEDTKAGESAESDPDTYFSASQKLVSIACYR